MNKLIKITCACLVTKSMVINNLNKDNGMFGNEKIFKCNNSVCINFMET